MRTRKCTHAATIAVTLGDRLTMAGKPEHPQPAPTSIKDVDMTMLGGRTLLKDVDTTMLGGRTLLKDVDTTMLGGKTLLKDVDMTMLGERTTLRTD